MIIKVLKLECSAIGQIEIIEGLYQNNIFKVKLLSGNSKGRKYYVITEDLLKKYTVEEQEKLVAAGKSQTMKSKHLDGNAVDLMAYIGGRGSWELNVYDDLADAMKEGANAVGCKVRWGAAWHIDDIGSWDGTMEEAMNSYIDLRRSQGRRPFIDGPHFELMT